MEKISISWRLPKPLVDIAKEEANALGLKLPGLITHILAERYRDKLTKDLLSLK